MCRCRDDCSIVRNRSRPTPMARGKQQKPSTEANLGEANASCGEQSCVAQRALQSQILAQNVRFWPTIWPTERFGPPRGLRLSQPRLARIQGKLMMGAAGFEPATSRV